MILWSSKAVRQKRGPQVLEGKEGGVGEGGRSPKDGFWAGLVGEEPNF